MTLRTRVFTSWDGLQLVLLQRVSLFDLSQLFDPRPFGERGFAAIQITRRAQDLPDGVVRPRVVRVKADRLTQGFDCSFEIAFLLQCRSEHVVGLGIFRTKRHCGFHLFGRLFKIAVLPNRDPKSV
jgi:hypothetical protein